MSLSQADRKAIATLTLCESFAITLRGNTTGRHSFIEHITKKIEADCDLAFPLWPREMTKAEANKIRDAIDSIKSVVSRRKGQPIAVYTSLCLGLISDIWSRVKKPKKEVLDVLHSDIRTLHSLYDQDLGRWDDYALATKAIKALCKELAG